MNTEIESNNKAINMYEERIKAETEKLQADAQERRAEREQLLQAVKTEAETLEASAREAHERVREKIAARDELKAKIQTAEEEVEKAKDEITRYTQQIDMCDQQMRSRFAPYGNDMENVLQKIQVARWHGDVPKGPLGSYVNLPERQWAPIMRAQLGSLMMAFAITDARDRPQMKKILLDSQK